MTEIKTTIAVILGSSPRVSAIAKNASAFDISGDRFEDVGLGVHNGFYDFLRNRAGAVIGLRYLPSGDAEDILKGISETEGLSLAREGRQLAVLVFCGREQDFDPKTSSDLYFGDNAVYRSKASGKLAIGFALDSLSLQEVASFWDSVGPIPA